MLLFPPPHVWPARRAVCPSVSHSGMFTKAEFVQQHFGSTSYKYSAIFITWKFEVGFLVGSCFCLINLVDIVN